MLSRCSPHFLPNPTPIFSVRSPFSFSSPPCALLSFLIPSIALSLPLFACFFCSSVPWHAFWSHPVLIVLHSSPANAFWIAVCSLSPSTFHPLLNTRSLPPLERLASRTLRLWSVAASCSPAFFLLRVPSICSVHFPRFTLSLPLLHHSASVNILLKKEKKNIHRLRCDPGTTIQAEREGRGRSHVRRCRMREKSEGVGGGGKNDTRTYEREAGEREGGRVGGEEQGVARRRANRGRACGRWRTCGGPLARKNEEKERGERRDEGRRRAGGYMRKVSRDKG